MQKLKFNSKRQEELYELIAELEYASYPVLRLLLQNRDRRNFKKNFKFLQVKGYIKISRIGEKVYAYPVNNTEFFNEREAELFNWFYLKIIRSEGKVFKEDKKILTATGQEFFFNILVESGLVKLYGNNKSYLTSLKELKNIRLSLAEALTKIE